MIVGGAFDDERSVTIHILLLGGGGDDVNGRETNANNELTAILDDVLARRVPVGEQTSHVTVALHRGDGNGEVFDD